MDDAFDAIRHGAAIRNHEEDVRRAVLDDCVSEIAQQLYRASGAHLGRIPKPWADLSMEAQAEFLTRAKAMVAGESALMRLRARANTADAVTRQIEGLQDTPDFSEMSDNVKPFWLAQEAANLARADYPRKLVAEYEVGRR